MPKITDWDKFHEDVRRGYAETDVGNDDATEARQFAVRLAVAHAEAAVVTAQVMDGGPFNGMAIAEALNMLAISPINNILRGLPDEQASALREFAIKHYAFCLQPNADQTLELAAMPVERTYGH